MLLEAISVMFLAGWGVFMICLMLVGTLMRILAPLERIPMNTVPEKIRFTGVTVALVSPLVVLLSYYLTRHSRNQTGKSDTMPEWASNY